VAVASWTGGTRLLPALVTGHHPQPSRPWCQVTTSRPRRAPLATRWSVLPARCPALPLPCRAPALPCSALPWPRCSVLGARLGGSARWLGSVARLGGSARWPRSSARCSVPSSLGVRLGGLGGPALPALPCSLTSGVGGSPSTAPRASPVAITVQPPTNSLASGFWNDPTLAPKALPMRWCPASTGNGPERARGRRQNASDVGRMGPDLGATSAFTRCLLPTSTVALGSPCRTSVAPRSNKRDRVSALVRPSFLSLCRTCCRRLTTCG
jgi:hypothetical protein